MSQFDESYRNSVKKPNDEVDKTRYRLHKILWDS